MNYRIKNKNDSVPPGLMITVFKYFYEKLCINVSTLQSKTLNV